MQPAARPGQRICPFLQSRSLSEHGHGSFEKTATYCTDFTILEAPWKSRSINSHESPTQITDYCLLIIDIYCLYNIDIFMRVLWLSTMNC